LVENKTNTAGKADGRKNARSNARSDRGILSLLQHGEPCCESGHAKEQRWNPPRVHSVKRTKHDDA